MKHSLMYTAAILLCLKGAAFADERCDAAIPLIAEHEALPDKLKLSLRERVEDSAINQSSIQIAREDAEQSGLHVSYMYPVSSPDEFGYYLIFANLEKDEMYYAYRVVPSVAKPLFKAAFYYMFMPEPAAAE